MKTSPLSLSLLGVLLLAGCGSTSVTTQPNTAQSKLAVAATFYPLAHFAEQVGGTNVIVTQITPGGVEPHDYEPDPQELARLQSSKVFLMNGSGLDPWAEKIQPDIAAKGIAVLSMSESFDLLASEVDEHEGEEHSEEEKEHSAFDPHIWLDPILVQKQVELIRDVLTNADPKNAQEYRTNAEKYTQMLIALDEKYKQGLASCKLRKAVTSHNAFNYLADRYNFEILAISGLSPDDEPSAKRISEIADLARKEEIDTIFFETLASPKISDTIAREIGAKTAVLNPIEGITNEESQRGETYISLMETNLANLRTALKCQ